MNVIHVKIYPRKVLGVQILNLNYNHGNNIWDFLVSYHIFSFATSETERGYWLQIASRVPERLKT